jgi:hypothetical protein
MTLTLEQASVIVDRALAKARESKIQADVCRGIGRRRSLEGIEA